MAIGDIVSTSDAHVVADGSDGEAVLSNVLRDESAYDVGELAVLLVLDHKGSQLRIETVEYHHVAVAHLIEDGDYASLAEGSIGCGVDTAHVFDEAVVADDTVAQCGTSYAAMLDEAIGYFDCLVEGAERHFAVKVRLLNVVGDEVLGHCDVLPVFCRAALTFEGRNLCFVKFPHNYSFYLTKCFRGAKVRKKVNSEKCSAHKKARLGAKASKKSEKCYSRTKK